MKKTLLLGGLLFAAILTNAQRLALYEEFSGENCAPCAATNPGLWTLMQANTTKAILLKYQSPIPTAGPIYGQNTGDVQAKMTYYSVNSAPFGKMDGATPPGGTHPGNLTQANIDAAAAVTTPFSLTVTNVVTGTNIVTNVSVSSSTAFTGGNMKLNVALVEDLEYATPPGTNGETSFHHVMRKLLTGTGGMAIANSWTAGTPVSYSTTSMAIPSYVNRASNVFVIAWIQDDNNKTVWQTKVSAAVPPAAFDATPLSVSPLDGQLFCGVSSIPHTVKVKNTGSTSVSGTVASKVNGTAFGTPQPFTVAAGQTSAVLTIGNAPVTGGTAAIEDIVTLNAPNVDQNPINNSVITNAAALTTGTLPQTSGFEGDAIPAGFVVLNNENKVVADPPFNGATWFTHTETGIIAQSGTYTAITNCSGIDAGNTTIITFPYVAAAAGAKAVDFYYAYAQRGTIAGDKLEVVYSTDCGTTWTSLWSKSGADLATAPATASSALFLPSSAASYKFASLDASAINGNVLMGFRATSGGGNLMYLDNVAYRTGAPATTGIEELVSGGAVSVYPNPVSDKMTVEMNMVKATSVSFNIVNVLGQQIGTTLVEKLNAGQNLTQISTSNLAAGVYFLNIATDKGSVQQKFVKN